MAVMPVDLNEMKTQHARRPAPRASRFCAGLAALLALSLVFSFAASAAQPVNGKVSVTTSGGYARLLFHLDRQIDATVRLAGNVLVITFKEPVKVAVDRINAGAPDYVSAARRDPDSTAIRLALARKVKVNTIAAGERLFVDLMPDNWQGVFPGLPQHVIEELARRAHDAERQLHLQRLAAKQRMPESVRVKIGTQPTFTRYVFDLPGVINVLPEPSVSQLILNFNLPVNYDLADARASMPNSLQAIESESDGEGTVVTFVYKGSPEVRTFREGRSLVVDIGHVEDAPRQVAKDDAAKHGGEAIASPAPSIHAPETVPAKDSPPVARQAAKPHAGSPAPAPPPAEAKAQPVADQPVKRQSPEAALEKLAAELKSERDAPQTNEPPKKGAPEPVPAAKPAQEAKASEKPGDTPPINAQPKPDRPKQAEKRDDAVPETPADKAANKQAPANAAAPPIPPPNPDTPVALTLSQHGGNLRLTFPFALPTPAAVFRRADNLWLVFDTEAKLDIGALTSIAETDKEIRSASAAREAGAAVVRIKLERPRLASLVGDGPGWILTIGDAVTQPTRPLGIARSVIGPSRASITIPYEQPSKLHRIADPAVGDTLMVITSLGPARGFLKPQDFVELRALRSTHGVVIQPLADDLTAELAVDKIVIGRPGGLSLSSAVTGGELAGSYNRLMFDTQVWGFDRQAEFGKRQAELLYRAATAPPLKRRAARLDLARFYLARDMAAEAKAVLDVSLAEDDGGGADVTGTVLRAVANVLLERPEQALKDLTSPQVGNQHDAPVWRAIANTRQGNWATAREDFNNVEGAIGALPIELQRIAMLASLRSSIAVRDFDGAAKLINDFEMIGVPAELSPSLAVLNGRLAEGLGRTMDALASYRAAVNSGDRRTAAQGRLREIMLRFDIGDMTRKEVIPQLEALTTMWRGDETEAEGLKFLAHFYTEEGRFRDAFHVMRTAMLAHYNSDLTRQIQDEASATFDSLFLDGKGDKLPAIEALGLFYDYRELTPIGRRGDEMIRRLADRLVAIDLLDQAAELLQHQVSHRLKGAARAQVATRLAVIYLLNRRAEKALATLKATRVSDLSKELRDQRLLLEARALSDIGRHGLAAEVISGMEIREAIRLRADIFWAARQWREAAEQIELLYGERWREFTPLSPQERADVLRAAIGFALGEDTIGLGRFREKYAARMAEGPDARAFDVVTAPVGISGSDFRDIAQTVAGLDTLDAFLRDMRARYPESSPLSPDSGFAVSQEKTKPAEAAEPAKPKPQAVAPNAPKKPAAAASPLPPKPPAGTPLKPDPQSTGAIIPRLPDTRASAR